MTKEDSFRLKAFENGKAYYCQIELEVKTSVREILPSKLNMEIDNSFIIWEEAIKMGGKYFFEFYERNSVDNLSIKVKNLDWRPGETNSLIVMYSVIRCLEQILDLEISDFNFDINNETVKLPIRPVVI